MSDVDRAELRRLMEEAETPWTIEQTTPKMDGPNWRIGREGKAGIIISAHEYGFHGRGEVIVAAVNALPGLLDALDVAEAAVERVREMAYNLSTPDEDRQPWTNPYRQEAVLPDLLVQACTHCDGGGFEPMGGRFKDSHACSVCGGEGEIRSHATERTTP